MQYAKRRCQSWTLLLYQVHSLDAKPLVERDFQFGTAQKLIKATK